MHVLLIIQRVSDCHISILKNNSLFKRCSIIDIVIAGSVHGKNVLSCNRYATIKIR